MKRPSKLSLIDTKSAQKLAKRRHSERPRASTPQNTSTRKMKRTRPRPAPLVIKRKKVNGRKDPKSPAPSKFSTPKTREKLAIRRTRHARKVSRTIENMKIAQIKTRGFTQKPTKPSPITRQPSVTKPRKRTTPHAPVPSNDSKLRGFGFELLKNYRVQLKHEKMSG